MGQWHSFYFNSQQLCGRETSFPVARRYKTRLSVRAASHISPSCFSVTMVDPIGILAATLEVVSKVYDVVQTIKDAPETVRRLDREVVRVRSLLTKMVPLGSGLSTANREGNAEEMDIAVLLEDARVLTTTVTTFLARATKQNDGTTKIKIFHWPLLARDADKLSQQFKAFYLSLTAVYAVRTSYVLLIEFWPVSDIDRRANVDAILLGQQLLLSEQRRQQSSLANHNAMLCAIHTTIIPAVGYDAKLANLDRLGVRSDR